MFRLHASRTLGALALCLLLASTLGAQIVINEIRIDEPGTDVNELFELAGPPGASLDTYTYLVIGDGTAALASGVVEAVVPLTGLTIPASGYFLAAEASLALPASADLVTALIFENDDNVTHMLVTGFTGALADDLDTDDDGVFDVTPWTAIVDLIAVIKEANPPTGTEYHYGPPSIGPDTFFSPSHVFRCPDTTGDFFLGVFGTGPGDTPGALNACPSCLAPLPVTCVSNCSANTVTLNWTNTDTYTQILIERDGTVIDMIAGTSTSYVDSTVSAGDRMYRVIGECAPGSTGATECNVLHSVYGGEQFLVFAGEDGTGGVNSVGAMVDALTNLGNTVVVIDTLDFNCIDQFDVAGNVLMLMLGTFPDKHELTLSEALLVSDLLAGGVHVYLESSDFWAYDILTALHDYDGIDNSISDPGVSTNPFDGEDSFTAMSGLSFGGIDLTAHVGVVYTQDNNVGNDYTDQLLVTGTDPGTPIDIPGATAGILWQNFPDALPDPMVVETVYNTGYFYDTPAPYGKLIGQSWEFGGFTTDQLALLEAYLEAFGPGTPPSGGFRRGNVNADGAFNIADAIFALSSLFQPGSPQPICRDAADANDDGLFNIADAVSMLGTLFVPGSPTPPPPFTACGPDPTADTLDCVSFPPCP
ncbi:MAG: dockerin type I repeat-containing protein [Planctomycetota bacterium]